MGHWTLTPAYGRDYKSAKEAKAAFLADLDWLCESTPSGPEWRPRPINRAQIGQSDPGGEVNLRYCKGTRVTVVRC